VRFQDLYLQGGISSLGNVSVGGTATIAGTLTANGAANLNGLTTAAQVDVNSGTIDGTVIGGNSPTAITGTQITANSGFVGGVTGDVVGNVTSSGTSGFNNITASGTIQGAVTGNVSGNVTSTGTSAFNNVTIAGTLNMDGSTTATIQNLTDPTNPKDAATKSYVDTGLANLVDSSPAALDTLNELAAAINDDADFSTTMTNALAGKVADTGDTMTGDLIMSGGVTVTGLPLPTANSEAASKQYTDQQDALQVTKAGDTMSGSLAMGGNKITGLGTPSANTDASSKGYVDGILGSATAASASAAAAATSEANAATSASNASTSASASANSATASASSATAAAASLDSFTDIYLGVFGSDPSTDNDGNALQTGALYYNSTSGSEQLKIYTGSNWQQAAFTLGQALANLIEDTTPQLGGNLDVNSHNITGTGNISITGSVTPSGGVIGNASTATALQTARSIGLSGDVTGSASFDGSGDVSITATIADDSHNHTIANVDGLQTALDAKAPLASPTFSGTVTATAFTGDGSNLTGVDSLPSQSGYAGKFLTTNGTAPSWATLQAESEITSNRPYWITDTSVTNQFIGKHIKLHVIPANTTISGTYQMSEGAELYVTEATSIDSFGEHLEGDQTISGNHIFYKQLEILDGSTITVTGTLEGFGDTPAAGVSTAALTTADVTSLIDGSMVFESFGGA
jgi:hypothetical protein